MSAKRTPIRRKLMGMILLTCGVVLATTCAAFFANEFLTFRQTTARHLSTLGEIIAANSTAALAFDNKDDASEVLSALQAERHIVAAALYNKDGRLFAKYPRDLADNAIPVVPHKLGYRFEKAHLISFHPVAQGNKHLGTLYLNSDMGAMYERFRLYGGVATLVVVGSSLLAFLLSGVLQKQISQPILALAETATAISERRDYSVRAEKLGGDEFGLLTDAFNHMLSQVQEQNQALSHSEARVRAVLNSAMSAVLVIDAQGRITDWNPRAEQMFGWRRDEALRKTLGDTVIPERYREEHRRGLEHFLATGQGPILNRLVELSALRRDGSEFPVELSISPLKTGNVVTFCGFITDISERKQAEQRLQAQLARLDLLRSTTRAIAERQDLPSIFQVVIRSLEDHLRIDFCCACLYDAARELLTVTSVGTKSQLLAVGLAMTEQAQIDIDQNGLSRCVHGQLVYEPDLSQVGFPFPRRLASGGLGSLVIAPLLVESNVFGVLVAARRAVSSFTSGECEFLKQLSEHVALAAHQGQLYGALQQAYDDLRQTQQAVLQHERLRALGQMASGIAHDINNALSPVALYTESLLETEPDLSERTRDYLQTIQHAIEDVAATVSRMREFYRQREPQLALVPVDMNRLAQQVVDLTRARWSDMPQQRGIMIKLSKEFAVDMPMVMGVESEIREALTNLIFNAVDAMPEGGTLTIRTRVLERTTDSAAVPAGRQVQVEVADTGIGMDEDTRRRCLEPFFTTKGERGTGLGLAMVYGMVQRHSAEIEIESAVGTGTTVRLSFTVPTTLAAGTTGAEARLEVPARLRILVVDDDPILLKSLQDTLERDGHVVVSANGGQAAIAAFKETRDDIRPFAVVISDLGMPYVDGRQVASFVKEVSPSTAVILLTGWGQRLVAEGDVPPHVDCVLNKPPKLAELREALARCCHHAAS